MADLDSGHIFLTTMAPIKNPETGNKSHTSYEQNVRISLARLPTARQSPATQMADVEINSPFTRNKRTHLARMFVLSDAIYNGRNGENAIVSIFKGTNTIEPQPVEQLNTAYLVFCADIDAVTEDGDPLPTELSAHEQKAVRHSYARKLWETMGPELDKIYSNCVGFENITSPEDFADYLEKCHVETTMPFHDYYQTLPQFHTLPVKLLSTLVIIPALVALFSLVVWLLGFASLPLVGWSSLWTFLIGAVLAVIAFYGSVKFTIYNGRKPLPPGKHDDLPSVLKALYVQQNFANFVTNNQGANAADLHQRFGEFLEQHKPDNKDAPTQAPGVISITAQGGISQ